MNKKTASENLQYIQSNEYKDMKNMFPLDDDQPKNSETVTKPAVDKKESK